MALSFVRFTLNQSLIRLLHQGQHGKGNESSRGGNESSMTRSDLLSAHARCCCRNWCRFFVFLNTCGKVPLRQQVKNVLGRKHLSVWLITCCLRTYDTFCTLVGEIPQLNIKLVTNWVSLLCELKRKKEDQTFSVLVGFTVGLVWQHD